MRFGFGEFDEDVRGARKTISRPLQTLLLRIARSKGEEEERIDWVRQRFVPFDLAASSDRTENVFESMCLTYRRWRKSTEEQIGREGLGRIPTSRDRIIDRVLDILSLLGALIDYSPTGRMTKGRA